LIAAPEVFVTGTTAGVWPVVKIDGQPVGDGKVGEATRGLRKRFIEISSGADPEFDHWLAYVGGA
jgi:branched-subunit amino acid aminotransferase/4-amino-4-deoxychorismate lyase